MNIITRFASVFLLAGCCVSAAHAGTQIVGTRVVYGAAERDVSVRVLNTGDSPRLLQAWVDSGNERETAETTTAPFLVTPPVSRVEPGKGQSLRLMFTGSTSLPQDRESVFWLNVVEVPPRPEAADGESSNHLQFAVRTRIKIFYRPKTLQGDPVTAVDQLTWRMVRKDGQMALECTNNTPFNVSFGDVRLKGAPDKTSDATGGGMCPAKGTQAFPVAGGNDSGRLTFRSIDDYGAFKDGEAAYAR
ncbi:fimbria/pilus periplasmic chaperone [Stenotrophomonas sp. AB1(2024)]|uniref:fimbria/pilus periplasmic chaperone n=1 Tax=Stenotrophomonas sp. AB1(2024) TaxID=3132215 RepID=UPI0030ACADBE